MRILISGGSGFIGRNLRIRLGELGHSHVDLIKRDMAAAEVRGLGATADFVFHLAGVNRPAGIADFARGNVDATRLLCEQLRASGRPVPIVYASSTQALLDNPYGVSKKEAEDVLLRYGGDSGAPVFLYRLPNVFGKWARPNYNSVIATFCDQVTRGQPISVHDPGAPLSLVYIDDVVESFIRSLGRGGPGGYEEVQPVYRSSVGEVASLLQGFARSRTSLITAEVGTGFLRALYATYVSYLRPESFAYSSSVYEDARGEFVEMLKTPDCGQFSYFTARSGVTRGEHYHHSKTEKFLVIRGLAKFVFRNIDTGEGHATIVRGGEGRIVETVPGWAHNITNVGDEELIVMLWANEIFDRSRPDTVAMKVAQ